VFGVGLVGWTPGIPPSRGPTPPASVGSWTDTCPN